MPLREAIKFEYIQFKRPIAILKQQKVNFLKRLFMVVTMTHFLFHTKRKFNFAVCENKMTFSTRQKNGLFLDQSRNKWFVVTKPLIVSLLWLIET